MSNSSRTKWEAFFVDAGIPHKQATEYSSTFSNNRMRLDMLDELNKDLLRDLGIKALGDIITILRYAKERGFNVHRSPSPETSVQSNSKQVEKIKSSVSLPTGGKTSFTNAKFANKTIMQKNDLKNKPVKSIDSGTVKTTQSTSRIGPAINRAGGITANRIGTTTNRIGAATNRIGTATNRIGTATNRIGAATNRIGTTTNRIDTATATNRIGAPNDRIGVPTNQNSDVANTKVSSKSSIGKARLKLSDRFDGFEVEAKRVKIDEKDVRKQMVPDAQCINIEVNKLKTAPGSRCINVEERFRTRLAPEASQPINAKDERKDPLRPTIVTALKGSPPAKPVQFTVQVPSKPPANASNTSNTSVVSKPNDTQPNVTVVPARGKALNRNKQITSIFDRLDAPSSSSVAAELLSDENQKNNVFRRLGLKSGKTKSEIDDIKITTAPSVQSDNKHGSESVFKRLGAPQASNI